MRPNQSLEQPLTVVMVVLMLTSNGANRRFEFQKPSKLFIRTHDETLSVAAMRVCNPDRSPVDNQSLRRSPSSDPLC